MPRDDTDAERFRRIRDRQLAARDPLTKQRRLDHTIATKHRRHQRGFSFGEMWSDLPFKVKYALLGGVIGLAVLLGLPFLAPGFWGTCIGLAALPFAAMVGFLVGRHEDSKAEVRDLLH
jgi:uncharacterized membrane protein